MKRALKSTTFWLVTALSMSGCMSAYKASVGGDQDRTYTRVILADYQIAWDSAVEALKASAMDVVNRENGTLQTKWIDNTAERNMIDAAGSVSPYAKAQYRFRVMLAKGYYNGSNSVRITVQKEQQIQRDVLEGWVNQESDGIQENSLIYRVAKIIKDKIYLQHLEDKRLNDELKDATTDGATAPTN